MSLRCVLALVALCFGLLSNNVLAADALAPIDAQAAALVAQWGMTRGICAFPRAGDGQLALAVARQSELLVFAQSKEAASVLAMRQRALDEELLGIRFLADAGTPAAIPFASDYVNLLLITDLTDADLPTLPLAEIQRVLAPQTGMAVLGLAAGTRGTLTKTKLEKLVAGANVPGARVEHTPTGLWAVLPKPAQPGAVDWSHRLYTGANNPVSADSAVAWPVMTQWLATPLLSQEPLMVAAGGRVATVHLYDWGRKGTLLVQDLHNGRVLWTRNLIDSGAIIRTSGMVLTAETLYLVEGSDVICFNPATGAETARIACKDLNTQVKWIAVENGVLYAMAGVKEKVAMAHQTWKIFSTQPDNAGGGDAIGAYDLTAQRWLWTKKEPEPIMNEGYLCVGNDRVYTLLFGKHLACLDAKTGATRWTNTAVAEEVAKFANGDSRGHIGALNCTEKYLGIVQPGRGASVLSTTDGTPIYSPTTTAFLFNGDYVFAKGKVPIATAADGKPSKALGEIYMGSGCGTFTLSKTLLCGQWGLTYDFATQKSLVNGDRRSPVVFKTPCVSGPFVADGRVIYGAVTCVCGSAVRGTVVQGNAIPLPTAEELTAPTRLVTAKDALTVKPLDVTPADWPTFRAGNTRANASVATVATEAPAIRWTYTAPEQYVPTHTPRDAEIEPIQAVAAGDLVYTAHIDGTLTALDLATGAVRWRFFTGARLYAPPTIWNGRCYLGSGDGRVYCLEATTGRQLWSYLLAPSDRRIMVYGDLVSTWPITGGVLVENGVAYAIAGIIAADATAVVALDATTGAVQWRNDSSGHLDSFRRTGVDGVGFPALGRGRLWLRTASYDLATGQCYPQPDPKLAGVGDDLTERMLNRYTGLLGDSYLISGGRRYFDITPPTETRQNFPLEFQELKADNTSANPPVWPWGSCRIMPSWNETRLLALPFAEVYAKAGYLEDLICWDAQKGMDGVRKSAIAAVAAKKISKYNPYVPGKSPDKDKGETFAEPWQLWAQEQPRYYAAVLAKNVDIVAYHTLGKPEKRGAPSPRFFTVAALDPATGKALWEVVIPNEPIPDGLSIARDGAVIVRQLDGGVTVIGTAGK